MADKYKIMSDATSGIFDQHELDISGLSNGVDEYLKATCLELLEFMGRKGVICFHDEEGFPLFKYKEEELTAQQLFENFL